MEGEPIDFGINDPVKPSLFQRFKKIIIILSVLLLLSGGVFSYIYYVDNGFKQQSVSFMDSLDLNKKKKVSDAVNTVTVMPQRTTPTFTILAEEISQTKAYIAEQEAQIKQNNEVMLKEIKDTVARALNEGNQQVNQKFKLIGNRVSGLEGNNNLFYAEVRAQFDQLLTKVDELQQIQEVKRQQQLMAAPFKLLAVDLWNDTKQATIFLDTGIDIVKVKDIRKDWKVVEISFRDQSMMIVNENDDRLRLYRETEFFNEGEIK